MRRYLILPCLVGLLALSAAGCSSSSDPASDGSDISATSSAGSDGEDQPCEPELQAALDRWAGAGFSGAVAISGPSHCFAGFGAMDADGQPLTATTVFEIGSVTKTITGAAVMSLVADGQLELADTAGQWLPALSEAVADVTVEQLLSHTAGLASAHGLDESPLSLADALTAIDGQELLFEPGEDRAYSNSGFTVLAAIVERAAGEPFRDYVAASVMTSPGGEQLGGFWYGEPAAPGTRAGTRGADGEWDAPRSFAGPYWAIEGNGGMAFSVRGLHDWVEALTTGDLIGPEGFTAMTTPLLDEADGVTAGPGWARVDASLLGEEGFVSIGGGGDIGHEVVLAWMPASGTIATIASNGADVGAEELARAILPAILTGTEIPRPTEASPVDPEALTALAGRYALPDGSALDIEAAEDALVIAAAEGDALAAVFPAPGDGDLDVAAHEAQAKSFLAGETDGGREELAILTEDLGPITESTVVGTGYIDGELRTFVRIEAGGETHRGWYAFDDHGSLAAVDYDQPPPSRRFVATTGGGFVPEDALSGDSALELVFAEDGDRVTITVAGNELVASRA